MNRRRFLGKVVVGSFAALGLAGCRGRQTAQVMSPTDQSMVGSHAAGSETFQPLVDTAMANLLGRHAQGVQPAAFQQGPPAPARICFVGVENKSAEEMGDFKDQIYQQIDTQIVQSRLFAPISRRFVDVGLREARLRPDQLFVPANMQTFTDVMQRQGQPFDYLLYATITSGTTHDNQDYQRDYLLTLEMINVRTGQYDKESATLRKGYNRSMMAKVRNFNPFK
ncbi:MAG: penicillin-binding protein activator LpoB [Pirellulales bacterium]|nr:penicillin-binding protein activator LpoB [Pirellulales bacterium]